MDEEILERKVYFNLFSRSQFLLHVSIFINFHLILRYFERDLARFLKKIAMKNYLEPRFQREFFKLVKY